MSIHTSFGKWLQARRKLLQMTQDEFAWHVGCTTSMLQKIEANQRKPSKQMAEALARALGIAPHRYPYFIQFARGSVSAGIGFHPFTNVLLPPTQLIGREQELKALGELIQQENARLVTLTGPPGVGKTHLALALASILQNCFTDGVYFVSLASIVQAESVIPVINQTIGLEESKHLAPLSQLIAYLYDKCDLIILDNFEHLSAAAGDIARLLAACPLLKILVTSRFPMELQAERQFPVQPLSLPDLSDSQSIEQVRECPSVRLFIDRAQAAVPALQLDQGNVEIIIRICHHLEGLPLAIELIAARLSSLTLQEILSRLSGKFFLFSTGFQDGDQRHHTLETAIEWSFNLLSQSEQDLFLRASVFTGNWSLEAFQTVTAGSDDVQKESILEQLSSLVKHNLIQHHEFLGSSYYSMLIPIREYAREKLSERFDAYKLGQSHASYYLSLIETAEPHLRGEDMPRWLAILEHERGNLISALSWSLSTDHAIELQLRLAYSLHWFWLRTETVREGHALLERVVARMEGTNFQDETTRYLMAKVRLAMGRVSWVLGDYKRACNTIERSLLTLRETDERWSLCLALYSLAVTCSDLGHYERALKLAQDCAHLADDLGDVWLQAHSRAILGELARVQGETLQASVCYLESIDLMRQSSDMRNVAFLLLSAAQLAKHAGEYAHARALLVEALEIHAQYNTRRGLARGLEKLAEIEAVCMNPIQAVRLLAAAEKLRLAIASPVEGTDLADYVSTIDNLRAQLDEQTYKNARLEGGSIPLEQMIEFVTTQIGWE